MFVQSVNHGDGYCWGKNANVKLATRRAIALLLPPQVARLLQEPQQLPMATFRPAPSRQSLQATALAAHY